MKLDILVGPPGSGKSTYALKAMDNFKYQTYINQDSQGKEEHRRKFSLAVSKKHSIIVDRMNFDKAQRSRYIDEAKAAGYQVAATIFQTPRKICHDRCGTRGVHETINDPVTAEKVINFFFSKYERPTETEGIDYIDEVIYSDIPKEKAIICDLDGTLCNIDHRLHHVSKKDGKKADWGAFFRAMGGDVPNQWCSDILYRYMGIAKIVLCSGRPNDYRAVTEEWLKRFDIHYDYLFMRPSGDWRQDDLVKETILDFDILPQFEPLFFLDDRNSVVSMWRKRGFVCLQCADGDF